MHVILISYIDVFNYWGHSVSKMDFIYLHSYYCMGTRAGQWLFISDMYILWYTNINKDTYWLYTLIFCKQYKLVCMWHTCQEIWKKQKYIYKQRSYNVTPLQVLSTRPPSLGSTMKGVKWCSGKSTVMYVE